jgi:sulfatase maturation enzyme AslB (radical SAM superfamily)
MKIRVNPWPNQTTKVAIFTGITCNLACTLCGPGASSLWRSELGMGKYSHDEYKLEDDEVLTEVSDYDFSKIDHVTFGGGEPMLNKSSLEIFQALNNNTEILFHSNGTLVPSQDYLDQFARFNDFVFVFSIDDIEEQFEFLRYPGKWNEVASNILKTRDLCPENVRFAFNTVVSLLNETTHTRVQDWVEQNIPTNKVGVKTVCFTNESNGLLNRLSKLDNQDPVQFLDAMDQRRGTNWRKTFPVVDLNRY